MKNLLASFSQEDNSNQRLWVKLFGNFSWLFMGAAGRRLIGLIVTLYLARVLGPQGFGQIAYALAVLTYFILLTDFGLQTLGTREIAIASKDTAQIVGKILTIRFFLILVSLVILQTAAPLLTPSSTTKNLLILFSFALIPMGANLAWFFRGREQMMLVAISELLQISFYLALLLVLVKNNDQLSYVPIIFVSSHILSALYLGSMYSRRWGLPRLFLSINENWNFFRIAVPVAITLLLHQVYFNFDTLMLGFLRSERAVGLYNAAYHVILTFIALNTVFIESIYPTFSKLHRTKPLDVSGFLKKTLSLSIAFAIPLGIAGTILGRSIIVTLYGTKYTDSTFAFQILVWSASLAFIGTNYGYCLIACQQQKALAIAAGIGTASNVGLNFLLIPRYGILGACLATLIAQIIMLICEFRAFSLRVSPTYPSAANLLKASIAGITMGFFLIYFNATLNIFVLAGVGLIIYALIFWLLRGFKIFAL